MRLLLLPALLLYAGMLVLSAWPAEVRPGLLDLPADVARYALGKLGIRGGMAVFEPSRERIVRVQRNDCFRVRGLAANRPPVLLHPPEGECRIHGFHPRIPPEEWMLRSLHVRGGTPLNQAVVGDYYCYAGGSAEPRFREIEVLWTQPWFDIETGEEHHGHVALYRWRCQPPDLVLDVRAPSDAEVERLSPAS